MIGHKNSESILTRTSEFLWIGLSALAGNYRTLLLCLCAVYFCQTPAVSADDPVSSANLPAVARKLESNTPKATLPPLSGEWRNSIRRVQLPEGKKLIAFTFDLCEREKEVAGYDAEVIEILRKSKVKATFFASGKWMESHPEQTMQLMADPLFEVGGHGWAHENFRLLNDAEAEVRFLRTQALYEALREEVKRKSESGEKPTEMERIPELPEVFRFPFGTCTANTLAMLGAHGVAAVQWDVVSGDASKNQTAAGITEVVSRQVKPGSIIIFHANGRGHGTARALPGLISTLRDRGFEFATVSELLRAGKPVSSPECYEIKPGDNKRYDRFK